MFYNSEKNAPHNNNRSIKWTLAISIDYSLEFQPKLFSPDGKVIDITMATTTTKFKKASYSWADGICITKGNVSVWVQYPWAMKRLTISVVFVACLVILVIKVTAQQQESLYRGSEHRHANFVEHPHTSLDVSPIAIKRVHDALYCAFNCLQKCHCFSFNMAVFPDADNKYECQLLATDKYSSSYDLKSTKQFNHHSILVREIKACHCIPCSLFFFFLLSLTFSSAPFLLQKRIVSP